MARYEQLQSKIHGLESKIETLATELRVALEELSSTIYELDEDEEYLSPQGNEFDFNNIQDVANEVAEIEEEFDTEN